ncbi:MAG: protein phosphatase 2C domain-containing protein [Planctomycetota bacterium]|nr:protein phosphatase 2C domain-containing protein [Planctomycetota bacterium]
MTAAPFAALSDVGRVRAGNEDRWFADAEKQIYVVSDGMGGQAAGEVASRIVVEILPGRLQKVLDHGEDLRQPVVVERIVDTIAKLSHDIRAESANQPGLSGMGATLVLAVIRGKCALIVHLGDSRAYLLRDNKLQQLTRDHTVAQALVNAGAVEESEAANHPAGSPLARFVGMDGTARPEASVIDIHDADRLLLCTDGLTGLLSREEIRDILSQEAQNTRACQRLIDVANKHGGKDNITALIVDVV